MAQPLPSETVVTGSVLLPVAEPSKKKVKETSLPAFNPVQYRAIRYVSFMLEDGKFEITAEDFIKEALARHLTFYQAKRGIEFPPKMLAELNKVETVSAKPSSEE